MANVNVTVRRGGRIIEKVERPLHDTESGPAVRYRRRLWPLNGNVIDLDGPDLDGPRQAAVASFDLLEEGPDASQQHVIRFPSNVRTLVSAGPGTGKTHVACQRIAALINSGVAAARIWVISFTRTAIAEFRNRIASALTDEADATSIHIATLDAHAWAIQSGFSPDASLTGSYDDNIQVALSRVQNDPDTADYLATVQHLIVDEAQDILGLRADLIIQLINRLNPDCGVTVFADDAQAIYGFTEDAHGSMEGSQLVSLLRAKGFRGMELGRVHRTTDPKLQMIFTTVRRRVLARSSRPQQHCERVREEIIRLAHENAGAVHDLQLAGLSPETLVLMRRRAEVLDRSCRNAEIPHRLRMSGLPVRILPWLSAIFWDYTQARIAWPEFEARWNLRVGGPLAVRAPEAAAAWALLLETAGFNARIVDLRQLRSSLGRASPPMLFCSPEFGDEGPVLSTVHASKGREADDVWLFLAPLDPEEYDLEEETRVSFVGATRARRRLAVGEGSRPCNRNLNGRVFRTTRTGNLQVEIGRPQDLTASGLTGQAAFATAELALEAQAAWCTRPTHMKLRACQVQALEYAYEVIDENQARLAVLSSRFKEEMNEIASMVKKWPPAGLFPYIRSLGLRSIILPPDSPEVELLHDPWRQSGFILAPLLTGYCSGRFGKRS